MATNLDSLIGADARGRFEEMSANVGDLLLLFMVVMPLLMGRAFDDQN